MAGCAAEHVSTRGFVIENFQVGILILDPLLITITRRNFVGYKSQCHPFSWLDYLLYWYLPSCNPLSHFV